MVTPALQTLGRRCARYLSERWGEAVTVTAVERIPGGASRETYRLTVAHSGRREGLILRRDPVSSLIDTLALPAGLARPVHPARHELDYWASVIEADALHPQPIAEAARRWLERHLPPPGPRLALVHGDYRTGNLLYDGEGRIRGVLDWEMAHLGDPLEDLAWSLDPLWGWPAG